MSAVLGRQWGVFWWAAGSVALMILGSCGPWARVVFSNVHGFEGDGLITLAISLGCIVALWAYARGNRGALVATGAGGLVAMGIGIYNATRIEVLASEEVLGRSGEVLGTSVRAGTVGWGLALLIAASGSLALASLVLYITGVSRRAPRRATAGSAASATRRRRPRPARRRRAANAEGASTAQPDTTSTREAGWYRNYLGPDELRYWDGQRWSEHTSNDPGAEPPTESI